MLYEGALVETEMDGATSGVLWLSSAWTRRVPILSDMAGKRVRRPGRWGSDRSDFAAYLLCCYMTAYKCCHRRAIRHVRASHARSHVTVDVPCTRQRKRAVSCRERSEKTRSDGGRAVGSMSHQVEGGVKGMCTGSGPPTRAVFGRL